MATSQQAGGRRRGDATDRVLRMVRILSYLRTLCDRAPVETESLVQSCGCSRSSLFRDLRDLEYAGLIERGERRGHWRLTESGRAFPMAPLTAEDAIALALARSFLDRPGLPHGSGIQAALQKATSAFSPAMQRLFREAARAVAIPASPRAAAPESVFDLLLGAISQRLTVRLDYQSQRSGRRERRIDPYGITYESDRSYLHGWCHESTGMLSFRLDRIHEAAATDTHFERDEAAWQAFRGQTGVFLGLRGGPPVAVKVRFSPEVADYAAEPGRWPEDWTVVREPDGAVLLDGTALGTDGILVEILRWRRHARVLGGPEFLVRDRAELSAMAAQYKNPPEPDADVSQG